MCLQNGVNMSVTFDFWSYLALGLIVFVTEISKDLYKFIKEKVSKKRPSQV